MEMTNTLVKERQHPTAPAAAQSADSDEASQPFVGRWNHLVSTTNWEKGRIIFEWRQALIDAERPSREYSDESWARMVGAVTSQHASRLRRVHERFGTAYTEYPGLYWSHFHAALDWDDAEMWLEGAVRSRWTVSQMRRQHWEATGAVESERPLDEEIVVAEVDEDVDPAPACESTAKRVPEQMAEVQGPPVPEGPDFGDDSDAVAQARSGEAAELVEEPVSLVRPFENLADLPDDLADAFEALKLAILRHKADGWRQISLDDVTVALDSLKELAWAPSID